MANSSISLHLILISLLTFILIFTVVPVSFLNTDNANANANTPTTALASIPFAKSITRSISVSSSFTRGVASMTEKEPNSKIEEANTISSTPTHILGNVTNFDIDWFAIHLNGGGGLNTTDNLTVKMNHVSGGGWSDSLFFAIYAVDPYKNEIHLLKTESYISGSSYWWEVGYACASHTGVYYIRLSTDFANKLHYNMTFSVSRSSTHDMDNALPNATVISAPTSKMRIESDVDHFDWYRIDSPDLNYSTELTISVNIRSSASGSEQMTGGQITYYTVVNVFILHEDINNPGKYIGTILRGCDNSVSGLQNPINYHEEGNFTTTYIGICGSVLGKDANGRVYILAGSNQFNGWAEYDINPVIVKPIIAPVLISPRLVPIRGRTLDMYIFNITYLDLNGDLPTPINVLITDMWHSTTLTYPMTYKYGDIRTGANYDFSIKGIKLGECVYTHHFEASDGRDIVRYPPIIEGGGGNGASGEGEGEGEGESEGEGEGEGENEGEATELEGPIVSDNIAPYIREIASNEYIIDEDSAPYNIDLTRIFEDPDKRPGPLAFTLWNANTSSWERTYISENLTATIKRNKKLELKPHLNKYGYEMIKINASDNDLSAIYEINVTINATNDAPVLNELNNIPLLEGMSERTLILDGDDAAIEDEFYNCTITAYDIDGDKLTFGICPARYYLRPPIPLPAGVRIDARTGNISFLPTNADVGFVFVNVTVNDNNGSYDHVILKIEVINTNDAPLIDAVHLTNKGQTKKVPNLELTATEDEWFNITIIALDDDLHTTDGDILMYSTNITESIPRLEADEDRGYMFNSTTGNLSFLPDNDMVGVYEVNFTVQDRQGAKNTVHVTLEIENVNDPPYWGKPYPFIVMNGSGTVISDSATSASATSDSATAIFCIGELITFTIGRCGDDDAGDELRYIWSFGDENMINKTNGTNEPNKTNETDSVLLTFTDSELDDSDELRVTHRYTACNRTYIVKLVVEDKAGANISVTTRIMVARDYDRDNIYDDWEYKYGLDPMLNDSSEDLDGDGWTNLEEYQRGTDPAKMDAPPPKPGGTSQGGEAVLSSRAAQMVLSIVLVVLGVIIMSLLVRKKRIRDMTPSRPTRASIATTSTTATRKTSRAVGGGMRVRAPGAAIAYELTSSAGTSKAKPYTIGKNGIISKNDIGPKNAAKKGGHTVGNSVTGVEK